MPIRATVDGTTLVLTYNNVLNSASNPFPSDFTVRVAGQGVTVDAVGVSGALLTLTLATAVQAGQPVTVDYRQGANLIHDVDGTRASDFYDWVVTNNTGGGGGVELVPTRATVTGTMLELTYNKVLNSASAPSPSDFTATVAGNVVHRRRGARRRVQRDADARHGRRGGPARDAGLPAGRQPDPRRGRHPRPAIVRMTGW